MVQVIGNIRGGTKKKSKKKVTNPWESDEGSGARSSSAEEQFKELDKEELMENHRRAMGNGHIDMLANMNTEQAEEMLMKFRENMGVTEDQKTLAMLSLMWMVERRKEEQRESQSEKEAEGEGTETTKQTCEQEQEKHGGKMETTLEKLADKKREDRRRLERKGYEIMELSRKHERKEAEERQEKQNAELWAKWEDRQRLERQGDEIMEMVSRHEEEEEEKRRQEMNTELCWAWRRGMLKR